MRRKVNIFPKKGKTYLEQERKMGMVEIQSDAVCTTF